MRTASARAGDAGRDWLASLPGRTAEYLERLGADGRSGCRQPGGRHQPGRAGHAAPTAPRRCSSWAWRPTETRAGARGAGALGRAGRRPAAAGRSRRRASCCWSGCTPRCRCGRWPSRRRCWRRRDAAAAVGRRRPTGTRSRRSPEHTGRARRTAAGRGGSCRGRRRCARWSTRRWRPGPAARRRAPGAGAAARRLPPRQRAGRRPGAVAGDRPRAAGRASAPTTWPGWSGTGWRRWRPPPGAGRRPGGGSTRLADALDVDRERLRGWTLFRCGGGAACGPCRSASATRANSLLEFAAGCERRADGRAGRARPPVSRTGLRSVRRDSASSTGQLLPLAGAPVLQLHDALGRAAADDQDRRHADQLGVGELHARRDPGAVVDQHPHARPRAACSASSSGQFGLERPCRPRPRARRRGRPRAGQHRPCSSAVCSASAATARETPMP